MVVDFMSHSLEERCFLRGLGKGLSSWIYSTHSLWWSSPGSGEFKRRTRQ